MKGLVRELPFPQRHVPGRAGKWPRDFGSHRWQDAAKNRIRVLVGGLKCWSEFTPYDLTKGRITYRFQVTSLGCVIPDLIPGFRVVVKTALAI